jgi:hypothetical protein
VRERDYTDRVKDLEKVYEAEKNKRDFEHKQMLTTLEHKYK